MTIQKMSQRLDIHTCVVPRSINLVDNSEASCCFFVCVKAFTSVSTNCFLGGGGIAHKDTA